MKIPFLYNRGLAVVLTVVLVCAAVLLSGGIGLKSERSKTEQYFYQGVKMDSLSISNDLQARADAAYNMVSVMRKYDLADDTPVADLLAAHTALGEANGIKDKHKADQALNNAVLQMHALSSTVAMTEQDARLFKKQYDEFLSRGQTISHDGYNALANAFNEQYNAFPAKLIGSVCGIPALELFE